MAECNENNAPPRGASQGIKVRGVFNDLFNRPVTLQYGEGSYIDPDVVVDTPERIIIGTNTIIRKGVVLRPEGGEIVIGNNCVINHYCIFHGKGGIYLGDWCIVAPQSGFYAQNHSFDRFDLPITKQPNIGKGIYLVGDNWIGGSCVICDDVTLGKGAIIGANSTVTKSVPMAVIAAGSPARVIKNRFDPGWQAHERASAPEGNIPAKIVPDDQQRDELLQQFVDAQDSVLEVGCGRGNITTKLANKASSVIGCDDCESSVIGAQERHPGITFVTANVTNLPFENNRFSRVVCSEVAQRLLLPQLVKMVQEIARVLRRDGALLLTTPITGAGSNTSTYAHIYEYSQQEVTFLLSNFFNEVKLVHPGFGFFYAAQKKMAR
jgi:acetyltransferase-like isoleucine patch superfamily enzyme